MGGKTAETKQTVTIPPEVMARYRSVNRRAESVANTPFKQYSTNPTDFVAPINQTQQQGIQNIGNVQNAALPFYGAGANLTMGGAGSVDRVSGDDINYYMSPYLNNVVGTTLANLSQEQGIQRQQQIGNAIRSGAYGGDRQGLEAANLARQQGMAYGSTAANLLNQGYGQALGAAQAYQGVQGQNLARQLQAGQQIAGLGSGLTQTQLQAGQALLGAGTAEQQTEQAGKSALYNQFLQERSYPFQVAQFLANIAMGTGALSGSTTTTEQPVPFFSDPRLKENMREIGQTHDGLPIYSYNYRGHPGETQIGLNADEVEQVKPEAVGLAGGYKTVDYDAATRPRGGLDPAESMGGAVMDGGMREGFAGGGMPNFEGMLAQLYSQFGAPYGAQQGGLSGPYGGRGSYVPSANLPVGSLKTAGPAPKPPSSVASDIMGGAGNVRDLGKMIEGGYDTARKGLGYAKDAMSAAAPPAASIPDIFSGLYADGGGVEDPMESYGAKGPGLDIPTDQPDIKPLEPAKPPPAQGSVMGDILSVGKAVMPFFLSAGGGLDPREGYAEGGSPDDDDFAIRTIAAEMSGKSPEEARAIAHVIENRRASGRWGDNYASVVRAPKQFEPWSLAPDAPNHPMRYAPDSQRYRMAQEALGAARSGEDITGGAMHFWAPAAQKGLGRAAPAWDTEDATMIGATRFVRGVDGGAPRRVASAAPRPAPQAGDAPAENAQEVQYQSQPSRSGGLLPVKRDPRTGEETTDWKKIIIPALTGLGAMASSNSLYAGSAMLQGLGAGAQAYSNLEKRDADIGAVEAQTFDTTQRAANQSMRQVGNVTFIRLANGKEVPIWEWIRTREPVLGGQAGMAAAEKAAERYLPSAGRSTDAGSPTLRASPESGGPPTPAVPAPPAPPATPGSPAQTQGGDTAATYTPFGRASQAAAAKDIEATLGPNGEGARATSAAYLAGTQAQANAAREAGAPLFETALTVAKTVAGKGYDAPGATYPARAQLASAANTIARALGYNGPAFSQTDTQQALTDKFTRVQALAMARGGGQESLGALQNMIEALPRTDMPPDAAAQVTANLLMLNQQAKDRDAHRIKYGEASMQSFIAAGDAFRQDNPETRYTREVDLLKTVIRNDPKAVEMLVGGRATAPQIEEYFKQVAQKIGKPYVPGVSRYFIQPGG